jgi:tetratricopeptide (TPR) repeat protein
MEWGAMISRRTTLVASAVLIVSMAACVFLLRPIDQIRPRAIAEDSLYVNSPKWVSRAGLGFNGLMACIYWTRAVQYVGHRYHSRARTYNELAPLLEITTTLDPHLYPAYQFGATFLAPKPPNGAGEPDRAIRLMEYGIRNNPDNWHLYYDLGFVYFTELKDYRKASAVFEAGSEVKDAHPFMKVLAAMTAEHAQDFATARLLWSATYESTAQAEIKQNALEHLRAIRVDEDVTNLEQAVARFHANSGRFPTTLSELASAEHLPGLPVDPDGLPYELTLDGHVVVDQPDDFPFATKGLPPGYKPGPPKFHSRG